MNADLAEGLSGPSRRMPPPTGAFIGHAKWLIIALAVALISNFGGVIGGIKMIGNTYAVSEDNIMTSKAVAGLFVFIFGLCAGPLSAGLAAVYATRTLRSRLIRAGVPFLISAASFGAVAASVAYLMQIDITFRKCESHVSCVPVARVPRMQSWLSPYLLLRDHTSLYLTMPASRPALASPALPLASLVLAAPMPDNFRQTLGGFIGVVYSGLGLATLAMSIIALRAGVDAPSMGLPGTAASAASAGVKPRHIQPDRLRDNACSIAAFFILGAVCFTLTTFLSSVWNYSATSYFTTPANPTNSLTTTMTWSFPQPAAAPGEVWYPATIYLKIYPDVVVYFASIFGLVAAGIAATYLPGVRRSLHKRLGGPFTSSFFLNRVWPEGVTRGEALVVLVVLWLYGYWAWYWGVHYTRLNSGVSDPNSPIADEIAVMQDPNRSLQKAARVLGHFTTLTMSFLTFPITRNSVWESAFGIPFDRAVKWHRVAGRLAWAFVTAHMVVWQIKWIKEGTLWNNVVTINNLIITPAKGPNDPLEGDEVHADNFTVVIAEFGWLVLTLSLVAANFSRRWNYELFHYLHHAVWIFFLAALFHAWSHWQVSQTDRLADGASLPNFSRGDSPPPLAALLLSCFCFLVPLRHVSSPLLASPRCLGRHYTAVYDRGLDPVCRGQADPHGQRLPLSSRPQHQQRCWGDAPGNRVQGSLCQHGRQPLCRAVCLHQHPGHCPAAVAPFHHLICPACTRRSHWGADRHLPHQGHGQGHVDTCTGCSGS